MRSVPRCSDGPHTNRVSLRYAGAIAAIVAAVGLATLNPVGAQEKKPNILFIMGDDIGWMQVVSYQGGLGLGETPNIDRIGNEGAKFVSYYAEQSCTAGRNAFFTGMTPLRTGLISPQLPGSPSYLRPGTPASQVPARPWVQHRRLRQESPGRPYRCAADGARVSGILGLSLPSGRNGAGAFPRH